MSDSDNVSQACSDNSQIWYSPSPGMYAVIRINAIEMVRHLADDRAMEAARLMSTKSYLICMNLEMDLPFPDQPWYRFEAFPIGPHLPPSRKAKGYTPEMCIPIYPNSNHPTGREPVHPERPFPYGNCYHWIATKVRIRVRGRPEGFDETNAISLSTKTELLMGSTFRNDYLRAMENADVQSRPAAYDHGDAIPRPSMGRPPRSAVGDAESASHRQEDDMDAASVSSRSSRSGRSIRRPMTSVEDIMAMDIFTGPAEDLYLVPLVDLWPELANNLKEEDIPSPLELYREIEMIQEIIRDARVRAYTALISATQRSPSVTTRLPNGTSRSSSIRTRIVHAARIFRESRLRRQARREFSRIKGMTLVHSSHIATSS